jgi:hypothetical protein
MMCNGGSAAAARVISPRGGTARKAPKKQFWLVCQEKHQPLASKLHAPHSPIHYKKMQYRPIAATGGTAMDHIIGQCAKTKVKRRPSAESVDVREFERIDRRFINFESLITNTNVFISPLYITRGVLEHATRIWHTSGDYRRSNAVHKKSNKRIEYVFFTF